MESTPQPIQRLNTRILQRCRFLPALLTREMIIALLFFSLSTLIGCGPHHAEKEKSVSASNPPKTKDVSLRSSWNYDSLASDKAPSSQRAMPSAHDGAAASEIAASTTTDAQSRSDSRKIDTAAAKNKKAAWNRGKMVWIKAGTFIMGSMDGQDDEKPVHKVKVRGFYLDEAEVTQEDYRRVMGKNPSYFKNCPACPVENVTWHEAKEFCEKTGKRLPREEEWEYACRNGSSAKYPWGDDLDGKYAWYHGNANFKTHPVKNTTPNAWGLYDMSGNVWEWCADSWRPYSGVDKAHSSGARSSPLRTIRGGAWDKSEYVLRSSARGRYNPAERSNNIGFRCAR